MRGLKFGSFIKFSIVVCLWTSLDVEVVVWILEPCEWCGCFDGEKGEYALLRFNVFEDDACNPVLETTLEEVVDVGSAAGSTGIMGRA